MKFTPLHLEILLHFYSSSTPFEGGPISVKYTQDLSDFGLIYQDALRDGITRITKQGIQIVHAVLDVASIAAIIYD